MKEGPGQVTVNRGATLGGMNEFWIDLWRLLKLVGGILALPLLGWGLLVLTGVLR